MKKCSIENCKNSFYAKSFCEKHYYRFSRYKDPFFVTPREKYTQENPINKDFFKLPTSNMAYIYGFSLADGNISKEFNAFRFFSIDKELIEVIVTELGGSLNQIKIRSPKRCFSNYMSKELFSFTTRCKELINDLKNLGFLPAKADRLTLPNFVLSNKNLFSHFLRGFFDGDGCFTQRFNIVSLSENFLKDIQILLSKETIYSILHKRKTPKGRFIFSLHINKKSSLLKLYDLFYKNENSLFLKRKFEKFKAFKDSCSFLSKYNSKWRRLTGYSKNEIKSALPELNRKQLKFLLQFYPNDIPYFIKKEKVFPSFPLKKIASLSRRSYMSEKKSKSTKIKRSFTIEPDLFFQFKSEVVKHGTTYSTVLESLISLFLKEPKNINLFI